jgi:DNA-binding CsgD family transcriptional regulator
MLTAAGRTNKQVSAELYISVKTVDFHMQSIYKKLKVKNRAEFVAAYLAMMDAA